MIHALLVVAVVLFVLWLLFHATGALVNLLWIAIIIAVVLWLLGFAVGVGGEPAAVAAVAQLAARQRGTAPQAHRGQPVRS